MGGQCLKTGVECEDRNAKGAKRGRDGRGVPTLTEGKGTVSTQKMFDFCFLKWCISVDSGHSNLKLDSQFTTACHRQMVSFSTCLTENKTL